ncbi:hypothetical protein [Brevibacillus sp. SYSU BS000544]|uniref:hypothetical protein n=1 Tax=Brevibacillus sp. SYSU BS000544 TaxID=3416443 RepID=UPI003CE53590
MIQVDTFENITHAKAIITRMGQRLSVHIYEVDGLLIDTGPRQTILPKSNKITYVSQVVLGESGSISATDDF